MLTQPSFIEKDFAKAMESLEIKLLETPHWRELLIYRGVSGLDAGYFDFYRKFLEVLRNQNNLEEEFSASDTKPTSVKKQQFEDLLHRFQHGYIDIGKGFEIISNRVIYSLKMQMPPKPLPSLVASHKALVVRSFRNTSPFPILKRLAEEPGWQVLFASWNPRLAKPVAEIGIPFVHLEDTYRKIYTKTKRQHTLDVRRLVAQIDSFLPANILGEALGIQASYDAQSLLEQVFIKIRVYNDIYFDLIASVQPDVVVLLNEISAPDRLMALVSAVVGVPSVSIQHGLYIGYVYHKLATNKVIVWGKEPKKFWEKTECAPDRVISVGSFAHEDWASSSKALPFNSSNNARPTVLFLGQNPAAFISLPVHRKTIQAVFKAIHELRDYDFVVKPHPGEDSTPYLIALEKLSFRENVHILMNESVKKVLLESDVVITVFSTAGLEAMLLGKPVIVLDLSKEAPLAPYVTASEVVRIAEMLPQTIKMVIENQKIFESLVSASKKYAADYLEPLDGESVKRAVQVIKDLVG